uniref:Uncharacterized protein n=1 Tax=Salix viminalis TaxID=40686 RepID=A0A6N2N8B9_SALVM
MAEGTRTSYSQLAESLTAVKQNQNQFQQNLHALQQMVQGLAHKLDVVASHVETLVQSKAAKNTGDLGGYAQPITNPLYEDNAGIHTRVVRLDFPRFNGENPSGWIYRANKKWVEMGSELDMSNWTDLLHSSTKLVEQAAPSAQFPPLQRNLDQLEALSKKLKAKTVRTEAPSQSIAATRLLAREGINGDQLARDLKSFELKTKFEDVLPAEATSVEEYLQQVHEMAMVSAIQEAQRDNVRGFNDYMVKWRGIGAKETLWVVYTDLAKSSLTLWARSLKGGGIVTCPCDKRRRVVIYKAWPCKVVAGLVVSDAGYFSSLLFSSLNGLIHSFNVFLYIRKKGERNSVEAQTDTGKQGNGKCPGKNPDTQSSPSTSLPAKPRKLEEGVRPEKGATGTGIVIVKGSVNPFLKLNRNVESPWSKSTCIPKIGSLEVPVREPSLIDSLHQVIASNQLLSLGGEGRVPFLKTLSRQGFRLRASEIKKAAGLRLAPFGWGENRLLLAASPIYSLLAGLAWRHQRKTIISIRIIASIVTCPCDKRRRVVIYKAWPCKVVAGLVVSGVKSAAAHQIKAS